MPKELFDAIDNHAFDESTCFLCGAPLVASTRSDEHVFPRWLQHRFGLWDQNLALLNGTTIPYRQLKIPCCRTCNNEHLSKLEDRIKATLFEPGISLAKEEKRDLYLWVAKILFGIIYRELLLPYERARPNAGPIVQRDAMKNFRMLHFFLQSARVPMRFHCQYGEFPASVFLFDVQSPKTLRAQFDFKDNPVSQTLFLRLGTKGVLAAFDGGAQDSIVGHLFRRDGQHRLHPYQLEELGAKLFYKARLMNRVPYFLIAETGGVYDVVLLSMDDPNDSSKLESAALDDGRVVFRAVPPAHLARQPVFNQWRQDEYAQFVSSFTGAPIEQVNPRPGLVMSWLSNERDEFTPLDIEAIPYRGVP